MRWAFWRSEAGSGTPPGRGGRSTADEGDPGRIDPALALRVRARRRLIGAAALLLAAVIVVPMVLDPSPRPVPDSVPIDIPSEKTPFTPRLPLPPVPDPGQGQGGAATEPPADAAKAPPASAPSKVAEEADRAAGKVPDKPVDKAAAKPDADKVAEAQRAREILEGKATRSKTGEGRYFVQAAAPRSEQAAAELAAKLKKAGLPSFTERVQASDGTRWRVRVGPYATRQEAERARARLRELGTGADLIAP
jgi:DedD protein